MASILSLSHSVSERLNLKSGTNINSCLLAIANRILLDEYRSLLTCKNIVGSGGASSNSCYRYQHKYFPACPSKQFFERRAFGQVYFIFYFPEWASWFSEHYTFLHRKLHKYPEICKLCSNIKQKMVFKSLNL